MLLLSLLKLLLWLLFLLLCYALVSVQALLRLSYLRCQLDLASWGRGVCGGGGGSGWGIKMEMLRISSHKDRPA